MNADKNFVCLCYQRSRMVLKKKLTPGFILWGEFLFIQINLK
jgi:hypothetical protein